MRKSVYLFLLIVICSFFTFSCGVSDELYGTWYNYDNGTRNAIQLSQYDDGKNVFIWAVYDIGNDAIVSNSSGRFKVSGNTIRFEFEQGMDPLKLEFAIENGNLILISESANMKLQRYVSE